MIFSSADATKFTLNDLQELVTKYQGKYPSAFGRYYLGMPLFESQWLTVKRRIKRTWRERLFGKVYGKWLPFVQYYSVEEPDPNLYMLREQNTLVGHPATIARLKDALNATAQK